MVARTIGANEDAIRQTLGSAIAKLRGGNTNDALRQLQALAKAHPEHIEVKLQMALAYRMLGDMDRALTELDAALAIDPYCFLALLSKGEVLKIAGKPRAAAAVLRDALKIAPRSESVPSYLETPIRNAAEFVEEQSRQFAAHLRDELATELQALSGEAHGRFEECLDMVAGKRRTYNSEPLQLHVPRLPAIPFFEREHFPWLEQLEAATPDIRGEIQALLFTGMPGFKPYVDYEPGTPVNQYQELNGSEDWSALWLWRDGQPQLMPQAACPKTTQILSDLPLADQPEFAPTAVFSALAAHTRIPPHTGSTNARLLVHLPLVLPGPAGFRVGSEVREWTMGQAWVFDDTIEHEAWNDAAETRIILIFDVWNPLLNESERRMVRRLLTTQHNWYNS